MKRKKGGKRCVDGSRVAGKADALARIERWKAEASGEVAERLQALGEAMARSQGPHDPDALRTWRVLHGIGDGMADAASQQLRQDW